MTEHSAAVEQPLGTAGQVRSPQMNGAELVRLSGITKYYGATRALNESQLTVRPGEIVGIVGHNGAGKSTLMRVVVGLTVPNQGQILIDGQDVTGNHSLGGGRAAGIRIAFQELSLCSELKVYENVLVAHGTLSASLWGWRRRASALIQRQLDTIFPGHGISPNERVGNLPLAQRQMVEIAQATVVVDTPLRLLILDEPTAALNKEAALNLFRYLAEQRNQGLSSLLISHRLPDILQHTDRTVVMRDGSAVAERRSSELTRQDLVVLMGGESATSQVQPEEATHPADQPDTNDHVVEVRNLTGRGLNGVSVHVRPGEIVGLAGLSGQGQHQFLMALWRLGAGRSHVTSDIVNIRSPLAYVTGDRQTEGVFILWSLAKNLSISALDKVRRRGLLRERIETSLVNDWIENLEIKGRRASPITSLSGGNQQKVLVARALASNARIILLDDPYRGVDVSTKVQLYRMMREETSNGRSFIWYTSENEELRECDRAYVFHEGRIVQMLQGSEIREERIIAASFQHQEEGTSEANVPSGKA